MAAKINEHDAARSDEDIDSYSIVERLADAIRIEDEAKETPEDRARVVKDLFEGPRKCRCCVNWVDEVPPDVDLEAHQDAESESPSHPLVLRRNVMRGGDGKARVSVHSVEIRNPETRDVLFDIFKGLDGIHPDVKYLNFLAPFCQFFWRWEAFEAAIERQENEFVRSVLVQLRTIVKKELAEAFAVSKELTRNGVITFKYLWTIFPPGELVFSGRGSGDRFFLLQSSRWRPGTPGNNVPYYQLNCRYIDYDGSRIGYAYDTLSILSFRGTKSILELRGFPAKYLDGLEDARAECIARGRKFASLTGIQYRSYRSHGNLEHYDKEGSSDGEDRPEPPTTTKTINRRIVLDAKDHPKTKSLEALKDTDELKCTTGLISQTPVNMTPPGGHRPLNPPPGYVQPRGGMVPPPRDWDPEDAFTEAEHMRKRKMGVPRRQESLESLASVRSQSPEDAEEELTDIQYLLCSSRALGYCLKEKKWRSFDVKRIEDIEWNTKPFESLVLPEGYKDLILSFVESQLKDGEMFDDVINGKGGGLIILLSGEPGVGKTLTAESVAEKMNAPLYKMELGQFIDCEDPEFEDEKRKNEDDIVTAFDLAAKWKAVLLIDECDLYLEKRNDSSPKRNRMVTRFLQELEYYPSLLFLTTNREKALDPAIYSRIHLTINYPALDAVSRQTIWSTFLDRETSTVTKAELDVLATLDVNGRRIRNITKTASIMAKRAGRGIIYEDIKQVMRITEGLEF